ncbi:hypothetical protein QE152_g40196 [Popillia japonica]|uniref:Uncharacterized protein n=1 Tax=Popillia japonica TaxID=7064 RepID=A0AAW1HRX7_POPJA
MDYDEIRRRFTESINVVIETKRDDNKSFLNANEYGNRIAEVKEAKILLSTPVNGRDRLIKPVAETTECKVLYYVTSGELFDIIHNAHLAIGHGGRNRMVSEISKLYCNITKETIMMFKKNRALHSGCPSETVH